MLSAFNAGTRGVSGAFDGLASAAGKSVDLSGIAKSLASIGKGSKNSKGQEDETSYGGTTSYGKSSWGSDDEDRVYTGGGNEYF
jgi:hypothetical protein